MNWKENKNWAKINDLIKDKAETYETKNNLLLYHWELKTDDPDKRIHISISTKNSYVISIDNYRTGQQKFILNTIDLKRTLDIIKELV